MVFGKDTLDDLYGSAFTHKRVAFLINRPEVSIFRGLPQN